MVIRIKAKQLMESPPKDRVILTRIFMKIGVDHLDLVKNLPGLVYWF